jgi:hypothetical protein
MAIELSSETRAVLDEFIQMSTMLYENEKHRPEYCDIQDGEKEREIKRRCMHIYINENGRYDFGIYKGSDGRTYCKLCGHPIDTRFDKKSVDALMDALEVIDSLAVFGAVNGLKADALLCINDMKRNLPIVAKLQASLNEFVKKENQNNAASSSLVGEYGTPERFTNITSYN